MKHKNSKFGVLLFSLTLLLLNTCQKWYPDLTSFEEVLTAGRWKLIEKIEQPSHQTPLDSTSKYKENDRFLDAYIRFTDTNSVFHINKDDKYILHEGCYFTDDVYNIKIDTCLNAQTIKWKIENDKLIITNYSKLSDYELSESDTFNIINYSDKKMVLEEYEIRNDSITFLYHYEYKNLLK